MGDRSAIEWTDATWNPTSGCTKVSEGCEHCYITRTPPFRMQGRTFLPIDGPELGKSTGVILHPDRLDRPLRWRRPRHVFVDSLSDLMHEAIPDSFIARVFAVMALADWHNFQLLTKRPGRLRSLLTSERFTREVQSQVAGLAAAHGRPAAQRWQWPLPNVWVGVSVESQKWANVRIPPLLATPAAVRFLSCEPLLGEVLLCRCDGAQFEVVRHPFLIAADCPLHGDHRLDWVIAGGESGSGSRPVHPSWVRGLRDQCTAGDVAFFFKQWGDWAPDGFAQGGLEEHRCYVGGSVTVAGESGFRQVMCRAGKKAAGRSLDGRTWDDIPTGSGAAGEHAASSARNVRGAVVCLDCGDQVAPPDAADQLCRACAELAAICFPGGASARVVSLLVRGRRSQ